MFIDAEGNPPRFKGKLRYCTDIVGIISTSITYPIDKVYILGLGGILLDKVLDDKKIILPLDIVNYCKASFMFILGGLFILLVSYFVSIVCLSISV